jgi:multimeric flavodoxin WrbA
VAGSLLVVWTSRTGGSLALAQAACDGARSAAATPVRLLEASQAQPDDLLAAAGYLFVGPEMLGSMAGAMKAMFERCYYPLLERVAGRPYAAVVCAGSDGTGAVRQLERIVTGWRLRRIDAAFIVVTGAQTPEAILAPKRIEPPALARAATLGQTLAEGLAMGVW